MSLSDLATAPKTWRPPDAIGQFGTRRVGDHVSTHGGRSFVLACTGPLPWVNGWGPPLQITTALSQAGILFKKGDSVELIDTRTGAIDLALLPDDVQFEVEGFNKKVVTVPFNRTVADELARHIDPNLPGKTLIFAVNDAHADIVVEQMKNAFRDAYGEVEDAPSVRLPEASIASAS
jgi:hypothetical protein